jgi:hypothetical protein
MELPAQALLVGVFLAGVLVGYVVRALISTGRRTRARDRRHDFEQSTPTTPRSYGAFRPQGIDNLPTGFCGAVIGHALAPQTQFPSPLLV